MDRPQVGVPVPGVDAAEPLEVPALAVEDLHRAHAAQVLVEVGVEPRQLRADVAERPAHPDAEGERHHRDQRQHRERHRHQLEVDARHGDQDAEQREQVAEDGHHAGGEQLVEHVHVAGDAGEQAPHRMAVEEGDRQALQVPEQPHPEIHHDALADVLHELRLQVAEPEAHQQHREVEHRDAVEVAQVVVADAVVHRLHREPRPGELHDRIHEHHRHGGRHLRPVGTQVAEQPPHQAVVVGLAGGLVVVLAHEASSSSSSCCWRSSSA